MTHVKCIIDIMKEKKYIKIHKFEKELNKNYSINKFELHVINIEDEYIRTKIKEEIKKKMISSEQYIFVNHGFYKKKDIEKFIENFLTSKEERISFYSINSLEREVVYWIKNNYENKILFHNGYMINNHKRNERIKKQQKHDEDALKFLYSIL